ncbi:MAG: hypothetical protein U9Q30_06025 [Campylobacterota bacterium]|nr:hypothetical protein [Campylobacterota bacterium]
MNRVLIAVFLMYSSGQADWLNSVVEESKNIGTTILDKTKDIYSDATSSKEEVSKEELQKQRFDKIWTKVHKRLSEGSLLFEKKNSSPESTWIGTDKNDVQDEIDEVLNEIIEILIGDDLLAYKEQIIDINKKIDKNKSNIIEYRNEKIAAPIDSNIYTTKKQYDNKIKDAKDEINILENKIVLVQNKLKTDFNNIGVMLTIEQINVLLTRIDGDDIIQISLVMDVLKQITNQIMILMKDSNEELSQAKRYYGMHLISLELIVYIQQNYIDKVNNIFIPKIDKVIDSSNKLIIDTDNMIKSEIDDRRKSIYELNLKAQKLTLEVANIYKKDLQNSRNNMKKGQNISKDNLKLAHNTYETVLLSSDLYNLISQSQTMFSIITKIQIPDITPFENIQIQERYKELTKTLTIQD